MPTQVIGTPGLPKRKNQTVTITATTIVAAISTFSRKVVRLLVSAPLQPGGDDHQHRIGDDHSADDGGDRRSRRGGSALHLRADPDPEQRDPGRDERHHDHAEDAADRPSHHAAPRGRSGPLAPAAPLVSNSA